MDAVQLPQIPNQQKKGFLKSLFFIEIGIFEVGFVIVFLGIIFFILNYYGLLSLKKTFPSLSSLPHLSNTPSYIVGSHAKIQDKNTYIQQYIASVVVSKFLSPQQKIIDKPALGKYQLTWTNVPYDIESTYTYTKDLLPLSLEASFQHKTDQYGKGNFSLSDIHQEVNTVFRIPLDAYRFTCQAPTLNTYMCNALITSSGVKEGITLFQHHVGATSLMTVFTCTIFTNSPVYATAAGCINLP